MQFLQFLEFNTFFSPFCEETPIINLTWIWRFSVVRFTPCRWATGEWSSCSGDCSGERRRSVQCLLHLESSRDSVLVSVTVSSVIIKLSSQIQTAPSGIKTYMMCLIKIEKQNKIQVLCIPMD